MKYTVTRRTFEAAKYPKGSPERARLNEDARTSEYYRSYKYIAWTDRNYRTFRTKAEAEQFAGEWYATRGALTECPHGQMEAAQ